VGALWRFGDRSFQPGLIGIDPGCEKESRHSIEKKGALCGIFLAALNGFPVAGIEQIFRIAITTPNGPACVHLFGVSETRRLTTMTCIADFHLIVPNGGGRVD
jgi:hypothetical protein